MDKNKKIVLLTIGVVVIIIIGLLVYLSVKKGGDELVSDPLKGETKKEEVDENQESIERQKQLLDSISGEVSCNFSDDRSAFSSAIKEEDIRVCDCIGNDSMKEDCKTSVLDAIIYMQALDQYDLNVCDGISIQAKKDACKSAVQSGIDSAKEKNPERLGEIYNQNNNYDGAISIFEESLKSSEEDVYLLLSLALSYAGKGLNEQEKGKNQDYYVVKALEYAEKAIEIDPSNPEAHRVLGYVYEIKPDLPRSLESYDKAIEVDSNYVLAYVGRGHTADLMGMLQNALDDYRKAAELDINKEEMAIYANLCRIESTRSDLYEDAIKNCKIVINSPVANVNYKLDSHQILAGMYMKHERLDEALTQLQLAKSYSPNDANLHVTFAELHLKKAKNLDGMEDLVIAEKYAKKATELTPTKSSAYAVLAYATYKQHEDGNTKLDEALEIAEKGLSLVDTDVSLLPANRPGVKNRFYWTMANIYNLKGDKINESKYLGLMKRER